MMAITNGEVNNLEAALEYHRLGLSVIPANGKVPAIKRLKPYLDGRTVADKHQLIDWFDRTEFNIAVVCGKPSGGLVVADFDDPAGYRRWAEQYPDLAATAPTVETGKGFHVWTRSDFNRIQKMPWGDGLRGKGIVIAPHSKHKSGRTYRWLNPLGEIPVVDPSVFLATSQSAAQKDCTDGPSLHTTHGMRVQTIVDAIQATLPTAYGQREGRLFELARWLKGIVPDASPDELRDIVRAWHAQALPNVRTKAFDASWQDFIRSWGRVKRPAGQPSWLEVVSVAETLELPACGKIYDSEPYHRLVKLCLALHQVHGGAPFPLSCRIVAAHCGCSEKYGATMLKTLVFDRILQVHGTHPPGKRLAHEYRFIGIGGDR